MRTGNALAMLAAAPYPLPAALLIVAGVVRRRTLRSPRRIEAALVRYEDQDAPDEDPV